MPISILLLALSTGFVAAHPQGATALSATPNTMPLPTALAKPVAARLSETGVRVSADRGQGPVTLDFWWVSGLPLKEGSNAVSWTAVEEGSLVGAVNIASDFRDVRGRVIKPGVYTLRYGIQPANGDHLGVSPYREFLLLSPAALDTDPAPRGHEGTIELSKQAIGGSHPGVWSIDPPNASAQVLQTLKTELDLDAVVLEVPVTRADKPAGTIRFGLVLIGRIDA